MSTEFELLPERFSLLEREYGVRGMDDGKRQLLFKQAMDCTTHNYENAMTLINGYLFAHQEQHIGTLLPDELRKELELIRDRKNTAPKQGADWLDKFIQENASQEALQPGWADEEIASDKKLKKGRDK